LFFHHDFLISIRSAKKKIDIWLNIKIKKKIGMHVVHFLASGRRPRHLCDACGASQHLKMPFRHNIWSFIMFSYCWYNVCRWWLSALSLMSLYFFYSYFFLGLFVEVLFVFDFIFQSQFAIYYFFNLILIFLIIFLVFLLNWFFFFNFTIQ